MTDTIDALRSDAAECVYEGFAGWSNTMSEAADEIERLRAVIDDAPHTELCRWSREWRNWQRGPQNKHDAPSDPLLCDCWKRAALRGDE